MTDRRSHWDTDLVEGVGRRLIPHYRSIGYCTDAERHRIYTLIEFVEDWQDRTQQARAMLMTDNEAAIARVREVCDLWQRRHDTYIRRPDAIPAIAITAFLRALDGGLVTSEWMGLHNPERHEADASVPRVKWCPCFTAMTEHMCTPDRPCPCCVEAEAERLRALVQRVRELHRPIPGFGFNGSLSCSAHCESTADGDPTYYPCETIRALDLLPPLIDPDCRECPCHELEAP